MRRWSVVALAGALAACTAAPAGNPVAYAAPDVSGAGARHIQWRALAAAGEDNAPVFDNAVEKMSEILAAHGVTPINRFTSDPMLASPDRPLTTADNMASALSASRPGPGQGCLVFLTSHGSRHGLVLRDDLENERNLSPSTLGRILDDGCGSAPTVAIVSGCFSGIFIGGVTEAANRIILTAARPDRTSFGCGAEFEYTYFDDCLFQAWPNAKTFAALYRATAACVRVKEREVNAVPSEPQASFGDQVTDLALP